MKENQKYRKERYIRQIKNKNGWSFQVRYKENAKIFSEIYYGDPRIAFNHAIEYRNNLLNKKEDFKIPYRKTIYDVMEESFDLLVVRQKTKNNHISLFNTHIKKKISLNNFNEEFVYTVLNSMIEKESDDTISRVFNIFKRIDKTCLIKKYYDRSVLSSVIVPRSHLIVSTEFTEPISKNTLEDLISACDSLKCAYDRKQLPLILKFFYLTGCRPCEVWPLTWNDVSDKYISINKELGSDTSSLNVVRQVKAPLSNRNIPLTIELKSLLENAKNGSSLIFPDKNGEMRLTDNMGKQLSKLAKKHGIKFNLYDLRHRFATDMIINHVDDRTKMELMGHKNIRTTLDYARSNDELKIEALKKR